MEELEEAHVSRVFKGERIETGEKTRKSMGSKDWLFFCVLGEN